MIHTDTIGDRTIVLGGLGRMLYQEGTPIGVLVVEAKRKGWEVSWLHIADELQKHGWSNKTILSRLKEECTDSVIPVDLDKLKDFLEADWDSQREMIFQYLFGSRDVAATWLTQKLTT